MASIKRKKTSELKRIRASLITGCDLPENTESPVIQFTVSSGAGGEYAMEAGERSMYMTKEAFARALGKGSRSPDLRKGLSGAHRFGFTILTKDIEYKREGKAPLKVPTVVGIHTIPLDYYLEADLASVLRERDLEKNEAVVEFHENGDIDLLAYPLDIANSRYSFVRALEGLEEISDTTDISVGRVQYQVESIRGQRVIFSCRYDNPAAS